MLRSRSLAGDDLQLDRSYFDLYSFGKREGRCRVVGDDL